MLILTRKIGEDIIINDNIIVTVCGIKGNQIKIGIKAPDNISIQRKEIYEKIKNCTPKKQKDIEIFITKGSI